jgi:hypothetical protein
MLPKILHLDIETAPVLAWVWQLFKPLISIDQIHQDWFMLCWAAKWHKSDEIIYDALWEHTTRYKKDKTDDRAIVESVWHLLDEADIVVAHNAARFDVPKINAKFFEYGMPPPSPYKVVDTLAVARARFRFTSNKLDYISQLKAFGQKHKTDFQLWLDVISGNKKQCERMLDYNIQDTELLEIVYTAMRPWITNHPNVGVYNDEERTTCTTCGSDHIHFRGYAYTTAGKYRRFVCKDCGHWGRMAVNLLSKDKRKGLGRNVAS